MSYAVSYEKRQMTEPREVTTSVRRYTCDGGCGRTWETNSEDLHQYPEDVADIQLFFDFKRTGIRAKHPCSLRCLVTVVQNLLEERREEMIDDQTQARYE